MMLHVPNVLTRQQVVDCRRALEQAEWVDGNVTSGAQAAQAKRNRQLPQASQLARDLSQTVLAALARSALFISAAIPHRIVPPLFNRYQPGEQFEVHVDNAIRAMPGSNECIRTDVSCTLFFSDPDEYDGGELVVMDTYGTHQAKLPAGDLLLYPSTSLHRVEAVTRGSRVASFFWVQSMVRADWHRSLLFDLDVNIQKLRSVLGDNAQVVSLTSHYHNLLRLWAEL
jgi:PKHD-type hydroxylase